MNEDFAFESSLKNVKQSDKNTFLLLKKIDKVASILLLAIWYKSVNRTMEIYMRVILSALLFFTIVYFKGGKEV